MKVPGGCFQRCGLVFMDRFLPALASWTRFLFTLFGAHLNTAAAAAVGQEFSRALKFRWFSGDELNDEDFHKWHSLFERGF